jgi:NTP pyrophosphatase (non-canonical NTP hydrolase)
MIYLNDIKFLVDETRAINEMNGWNLVNPTDWNDPYKIPAVLALIHSEVSEALEAFRGENHEMFKEEIADIVIRCFDLAGGIDGMDLYKEIVHKLDVNRKRGVRHGGKKL